MAVRFATFPGKAVRVLPIKPRLKAPGTKRLKMKHDRLLSNLAFNFNWRRYTRAPSSSAPSTPPPPPPPPEQQPRRWPTLTCSAAAAAGAGAGAGLAAGAYTRSLSAQLELPLCPT